MRTPCQVIAFKALPLSIAPFRYPSDVRFEDVRMLYNEITIRNFGWFSLEPAERLLLAALGAVLDRPHDTALRLILGLAIQAAAQAWASGSEPGTIQSQPEYWWNEGQYA